MKIGEKVSWKWGKRRAEGKIVRKFRGPVERKIQGTEVKRNATPDEPAYLIEQKNGARVLKSESELKTVQSKKG